MVKKYYEFTNESFLGDELLKLGYKKNDLDYLSKKSYKGELRDFLESDGKEFTFGILNAIYKDAIKVHKQYEIKKGSVKAVIRLIPIVFSPLSILLAYVGMAFGYTRAVNKIVQPVLQDPGRTYSDFLRKIINKSMKLAEGEISGKDPLSRAFVVSDGLVDMLKDSIVYEFSYYLSNKMMLEDTNSKVPDFYIENELRKYINIEFKLNPSLLIKTTV